MAHKPTCSDLCAEHLVRMRASFSADPRNRAALNAVTKSPIKSVALNRDAAVRVRHTFSHIVKSGPATSQASSGRCWMFAGLNLFRTAAAEQMALEDFEISQNYLFFWDKVERANYFLQSIVNTLHEPTDGRLLTWMMGSPIQDGGQWDMFVNLVRKYGVVPKEVMPETESSSSTGALNDRLTWKLREYACKLRTLAAAGAGASALQRERDGMMDEIYRITAIHLGEPPTTFLWQWRDKEKYFHRDGEITPVEFFQKHVPVDLDALVCLIHCPQASKQYNTCYTVQHLGNIVGGQIVRYLNVELSYLKTTAIEMIKAGRPVWFGCDVGKMLERDLGVMDTEIYDYQSVYQTTFGMDKAERLDYGQSQMTHAMVLTGVDLDDTDSSTKWRVENSWGDKGGDKGYMIMSDSWFDEYLYEVVVDRKYVPAEILEALKKAPVELPPWDPMGALAS